MAGSDSGGRDRQRAVFAAYRVGEFSLGILHGAVVREDVPVPRPRMHVHSGLDAGSSAVPVPLSQAEQRELWVVHDAQPKQQRAERNNEAERDHQGGKDAPPSARRIKKNRMMSVFVHVVYASLPEPLCNRDI